MKVSINESTLTAIGNAIREKTGKSDLIAPGSMPAEIRAIESGGGGGIEVEPVVLTGAQTYGCSGPIAGAYIKMFGDTISTKDIWNSDFIFYNSTVERIPFAINYSNTSARAINSMFQGCMNLTEVPEMNNVYPNGISALFKDCRSLRELPENFGANWNYSTVNSYAYGNMGSIFSGCYSLRKIPSSFLSNLWGASTSSSYTPYYNGFHNCYALDEIRGLPVQPSTLTSNGFNLIVGQCGRLKTFTFATNEDGSPKTANWKSQVIDMASLVVGVSGFASYAIGYNSGITADKQVKDDATYQALKNDPDWFTTDPKYSRYNHDSAVETINSLPDTSAYGTNTIKFKGDVGELTDGGAINTLTEAEIAVAAAKGWTVTLS